MQNEENKLKVLELFAGIGACSKALERLNIPHEIVDAVEIDRFAVEAFNAIHGTSFEPQDITKWDKDIKVDLIMHGSPCQDFSVAGLGKGGDKGSGTRSSLMYETLRIVEKLKPKYVIWENVKNLLSAKHKPNFDAYQKAMEDLGYKNFYQVLNAKDFGVPQNRERVFTVSIRREKKMSGMSDPVFQFPDTMPLMKRLKDILDDKVDESFYLSNDRVKKIKLWEKRQRENGRGFRFEPKSGEDVAQTVSTAVDRPSSGAYYKEPQSALEQPVDRDYNKHGGERETQIEVKGDGVSHNLRTNGETLVAEPKTVRITGLYDKPGSKHQAGSIYDKEGTAPTLSTMQGGNLEPLIVDDTYKNRDPREYEQVSPTLRAHRSGLKVVEEPYVVASRGRQPKGSQNACEGANTAKKYEQSYEPNTEGTTNTLTSVQKDNLVVEPEGFVERNAKEFIDKNGYYPENFNPYNKADVGEVAPTQSTQAGSETSSATVLHSTPFRIRKLTPKECYRLMGFDDEDYEKASKKISKTQLYKTAGNSIVVNVLEAIFRNLFDQSNYKCEEPPLEPEKCVNDAPKEPEKCDTVTVSRELWDKIADVLGELANLMKGEE